MVESFIKAAENFLETDRIEMSFREQWNLSPPPEAEGKCLDEFLRMVRQP
jgi:hypothetical protein